MFEQTFKNIDDVLWKDAGCTSELDDTQQSSWLLFLKYLDTLEQEKAMEAELEGNATNSFWSRNSGGRSGRCRARTMEPSTKTTPWSATTCGTS